MAYDPGLQILLRHMPGKHDQSTHGHSKVVGKGSAAAGQAALDAVPLGPSSADVTSSERSSLFAYTSPDHFRTINGDLRGELPKGARPPDARSKKIGRDLDAVMARSRTSEITENWRGINSASTMFGDRLSGNMKGLEWHEKAYVSTSVRKSSAQEFSGGGKDAVLMRVRVPSGTGAAKMVNKEWDGEGEVLLERGLKFRVTADHGYDRDWGHRVLDVEIVA